MPSSTPLETINESVSLPMRTDDPDGCVVIADHASSRLPSLVSPHLDATEATWARTDMPQCWASDGKRDRLDAFGHRKDVLNRRAGLMCDKHADAICCKAHCIAGRVPMKDLADPAWKR